MKITLKAYEWCDRDGATKKESNLCDDCGLASERFYADQYGEAEISDPWQDACEHCGAKEGFVQNEF